MALIRYPGSKEKLAALIWERFPPQIYGLLWSNQARWEYREPFFGAGAIGFKVLRELSSRCGVRLNDIDPGISALWSCVRYWPQELIERITYFRPSPELFYRYKEEDGRIDLPLAEIGFRKLALHRMSYSGLGFMAGGPLGGKKQDNAKYPIDCRWCPEKIKKDMMRIHRILSSFDSFSFTCGDFATLIEGAPAECFLYLDPPYYKKGPDLYKHSMSEADHIRLERLLSKSRATWVLSYDDHKFIRELYWWARIEKIETVYTCKRVKTKERPKNKEIIITPPVS